MLRSVGALWVIGVMGITSSAFATNGYWSTGYGTKSKAMAGACVAMELGPMCAASNPATLVHTANQVAFGMSLFAPNRGYIADNNAPGAPFPAMDAGTFESANDLFLIPYFGVNYRLDDDSSFGVAVGGNGGLNTEYNDDIFYQFNNPAGIASGTTSIDMKQMFFGFSYSRKLNDQHSIGITPVLAVQTLEVKGLEPFQAFSSNPAKVSNNGVDYSYGGGMRLGWLWKVNPRLNVGASYQTRLYMSKFDNYSGLLAEQGDFDIPATWDLGFAYKFTPEWTFSFDWQRIEYSDVAAIGNASDQFFFAPGPRLGADDGMGFGWRDISIYKFGLQWELASDWTLRAGYSHSQDAVPPTQAFFNILAPAVVTDHYSFGVSRDLDDDSGISFAFSYMPEGKVSGWNPNTGGPNGQTGSIYMSQWEFELGYSMSF